jgi:D-sedoheptulose 7-phosphate isomerase
MNEQLIRERFESSIETKKKIIDNDDMIRSIDELANTIANTIANGGKLLICGNGGSASDALHIAGEIVGRFQKERKSYAAIALNSDVATMTAIANDYGYDEVFSRQVEGLMNPDDILLGISTSGNSQNIIKAFEKAHEIGGKTALLSGRDGGKLKSISDFSIVVPSDVTARIQESHLLIYHIMCEIIENTLSEKVG